MAFGVNAGLLTCISSTTFSNLGHPRVLLLTVFGKAFLKRPIRCSNWPPCYGAWLRLKCHLIYSVWLNWNLLSCCIFCNHFSMALNVEPLSEWMTSGLPLWAMKCFKLAMNSDVCNDFMRCRWTVLVRLHAYNPKHAVLSFVAFGE